MFEDPFQKKQGYSPTSCRSPAVIQSIIGHIPLRYWAAEPRFLQAAHLFGRRANTLRNWGVRKARIPLQAKPILATTSGRKALQVLLLHARQPPFKAQIVATDDQRLSVHGRETAGVLQHADPVRSANGVRSCLLPLPGLICLNGTPSSH